MPNCFNIVTQSLTRKISYETKLLVSRIAMATVRNTLVLKRCTLCCTYFIKLCVNVCLLHNLNNGIGVELQGNHRKRILFIASFHYRDIKTFMSSTSKRHQHLFMESCLDCIGYTPFNSHIFMAMLSSNFQKYSAKLGLSY